MRSLTNGTPAPNNNKTTTLINTTNTTLNGVINDLAVNGGGCTTIRTSVLVLGHHTTTLHGQLRKLMRTSTSTFAPLTTTCGLPGRAPRRRTRGTTILRATLRKTYTIPLRVVSTYYRNVTLTTRCTRGNDIVTMSSTKYTTLFYGTTLRTTKLGISVGAQLVTSGTHTTTLGTRTSTVLTRFIPRTSRVCRGLARSLEKWF